MRKGERKGEEKLKSKIHLTQQQVTGEVNSSLYLLQGLSVETEATLQPVARSIRTALGESGKDVLARDVSRGNSEG